MLSGLRQYRGLVVILASSVAAFGFLAHEDRASRHAAGIDDTCAWFQMVNRQFPMNRCFSFDEFLDFIHRQPGPKPAPASDRGVPVPILREPDPGACDAAKEAAPSSDSERSGPNYIYRLLQCGR
ncbi:MAG: hypothetical protein ACM30I_01370 [Gemmatimonas sp.]